jgi:hypothetical protein
MKDFLNIRPGKKFDGIVEKLEILSKKENRTLNNYVLIVLDFHVKSKNKKSKSK